MNAFQPVGIESGCLVDISDGAYPTKVYGWHRGGLGLRNGATHYGMVTEGVAIVDSEFGQFRAKAGSFFVVPGVMEIVGNNSRGLVISRLDYHGLFQHGGPIEPRGRLRYIDGCSDTLLVCPPVVGEPCLNHLHIPAGIDQTAHTHPSERIGVILRGSGECRTPGGNFALTPGMGWRIPPETMHSFHTPNGESLDVLAWHPDSDFGPSHDDHPMVNRTYVAGVSAAEIDDIRTTEIAG